MGSLLTASDGVTSQLSTWIYNLKSKDIPPEIIERAKYLVLDGVACGLVGARVPWSEAYVQATNEFEPAGEYSVIGHDHRLGPIAAVLQNSTFIQACELDDYHSTAPLHSLSIILPTLFAATESQYLRPNHVPEHVSGLQFLIACIVGFETGPRAGKALYGDDVLKRGWHSGPLFGSPASAAAASKLFNLSPEQIEDAIGMACTQAGGLMSAQYEGMVKRAQHGFAARNGLLGALLARGNYKGIKKVFERPYGGFLAMFSSGNGKKIPYKEWEIVDRLGSFWHTYAIRIKLYACMGTLHGTLEALENLQRKHAERFRHEHLSNITSINVGLSDASYAHGGWPVEERPMTSTGSQMSGQYCVALQLVDRQVLLDQFKEGTLDRDEIWDLVYKTNCFHTEEFDKPDHLSGSRVSISFSDGTTVEEVVNMPRGFDPPLPNELIREKYRRLIAPIISHERMVEIEDAVLSLDQSTDVRVLLKMLTGPVGRALV